MGVISFQPKEGRKGTVALQGLKTVWTYSRTWEAITDDRWDDESAIEAYIDNNPDTPKYLSVHPNNEWARLNQREIVQQGKNEDGRLWLVNASYTTDLPPMPESDHPLDQPAKIEYQSQKRKRVIWVDKDGKLCVNTAYQLFDPPLEIDETGAIVTITRNEQTFSFASHMLPMENHTNLNPIWGAAAKTLLIQEVNGSDFYYKGQQFWNVRYRIEYNARGWDEEILSRGMMQISINTGKLIRCKDGNQQDVTEPVPLDADGHQILVSDLPGAAHNMKFRTKDTFDFDNLNINL